MRKWLKKTENEQVNVCGHKYNIDMYDWMDLVESSQSVDSVNEVVEAAFGPKPSEQQVSEFSRYRGMTTKGMVRKVRIEKELQQMFPRYLLRPPNSIAPNT